MSKLLYLMRHGETLFNVRHKIQGWCDSPLTEKGIQQAEYMARRFETIEIDHFYSSTAERSCDTVEIVSNHAPYTRLKGIKEMSFGIFEGESEDLNPKIELYETFFVPYGGETVKQVQERMCSTLTEIMNKDDHQKVLAVSHAGSMMNFLMCWNDPNILFKYGKFSNCSVMVFEFENNRFNLIDVMHCEL